MSLVDPDYDCSVKIPVNTDVGGPGVVTSFLVIAAFTIFLAFFQALEVFIKWQGSAVKDGKRWYTSRRSREKGVGVPRGHRYTINRTRTFIGAISPVSKQRRGQQLRSDLERPSHIDIELRSVSDLPADRMVEAGVHSDTRFERHAAQHPSVRQIRDSLFDPMYAPYPQVTWSRRTGKIVTLLRPLCDLQIVTGLAIIVAGMGQWHSIDFYHEQLVNAYYALTLNSFWATRASYMDVESNEDAWVLFLRRAAVLVSCILNIIWQFRLYFRETASGVWDDDTGPCFRYLDRSNALFSTIFWTTGLTFFCLALASCLFKRTRWVNEWYFAATEWLSQFLWSWFQAALDRDRLISHGTSGTSLPSRRLLRVMLLVIEVLASGFAVVVYFLFLQLLDVWSYGDGFYPLTWLAYLGFYAWNALDVISMVLLNRNLLQDEEWAWGFGQVLPMVLILSVLFLVVDVFRERVNSIDHLSTTELLTRRMFILRQIRATVKRVPSLEHPSTALSLGPTYDQNEVVGPSSSISS